MALNLATWKTTLAERLPQWRQRMQQAEVDSIYAFLAAVALWPVAAAVRAGDLTGLFAVGGVLGGMGSPVLVNWLQSWQDEAEAARQLAATVATEPDLCTELDAVLTTLDVFRQAGEALPESARQWFVETLQTELARLGNATRLAAHLTGSGASAQGPGAVAAGAHGVAVGGNVQDSTIIIGNVYTGPPTRVPAKALAIYRRVLVASARHMSLQGLDVSASDPTGHQQHFDLTQVYVDLHTTTQVAVEGATKEARERLPRLAEIDSRPLSALEAVSNHRQVVLLGDPGSGKSTFLTHLAHCLAAHSLAPQAGWLARLASWPPEEADVVPITVVLRDFARWLPTRATHAEPSHLWQFIVSRLKAQNLAFVATALQHHLDQGKAVLLLDGLDEIPTARQRTFIRDAVAAFSSRYPQCRTVVTCRTLPYQDPAWQLAGFASFTLAAFSEAQIDRFITAWYGELARLGSVKPEVVESVTRHLQTAIRRPDLWRLAANPLLLTVMALVHTHKGRLPEARALLYEETVDILLWRWEQLKASGTDEMPRLQHLLAQAERTDVDLKRVLWELAFEAHRAGGTADTTEVADIGELQLSRALSALHPTRSRDWAYQVMEVMQLRAGLLLERVSGVYAFPHRTFQEYLAGAHLSTQADFASQAAQLAAAGPLWREVILLAVGRLVYQHGETAKPLTLVAELCPTPLADTAVAWRQAWLAGDVLLEMGRNRVQDTTLGRELVERVCQRLVCLIRSGHLSPLERAASGDTLARLGDPRFRADVWYLPDEPLLGFVEIPAGPFKMGSQKRDSLADEDEKPQHTLKLPRYYITRYPVTVAQFWAFVEASGYQPADKGSLQGLPNHPVVYVTWYDAIMYCDWLTERLRDWESTPEPLATLLRQQGWCVTLPSEAEWEKAARGSDGRRYPWSNKPDPERANYSETGIHTTSAVGCFPGGASPYSVEELSGNVLEWTRSLWRPEQEKPIFGYPYRPDDGRENLQASDEVPRVLRGGAFWAVHQNVRCASRSGNDAQRLLRRWISRRGAPMSLISDPLDSAPWGSPEGAGAPSGCATRSRRRPARRSSVKARRKRACG